MRSATKPRVEPVTLAIPGALVRRDVEGSGSHWSVEVGRAARGDAWTDPVGHKLRVPSGDDDISRIIRAHEMLHAATSPRVSPSTAFSCWPQFDDDVLIAVDEIRVNRIVATVGYDRDDLRDGSEETSGERVSLDDWNSAVTFTAATHGGRAQKDFLSGMKKGPAAEFVPELRKMVADLKRAALRLDNRAAMSGQSVGSYWGSTDPVSVGISGNWITLPQGFVTVVNELAPIISRYLRHDDDDDAMPGGKPRALNPDKDPNGERHWAPIVVGPTDLTKTVPHGSLSKKRTASPSGTRVAYPSRLLTDPKRRVFGIDKRAPGGVVLVDVSGSMAIDDYELNELIQSSRGLTVLAYSHSRGCTSNAWVLARDGRRVEWAAEYGNGGNGCDGPAVEWANAMRRPGEPFVWVFDGHPTDADGDALFGVEWCAEAIRRYRIHVTPDLRTAITAFRRGSSFVRSMRMSGGPVGDVDKRREV